MDMNEKNTRAMYSIFKGIEEEKNSDTEPDKIHKIVIHKIDNYYKYKGIKFNQGSYDFTNLIMSSDAINLVARELRKDDYITKKDYSEILVFLYYD